MKIHLVKKGDTLFEIAKKHGVTLEQLLAANPHIADPDRIEVGMKVKIPMVPKPVPQPPVEYKHKVTVSQGDTMWKISKAWEVPLKALIDANPHLKNPSVLLTGDTIYIPKLKQDGTLMHIHSTPKAELTAPMGKADTAPMGKANTAPIGKANTAPIENAAPVEEAPVVEAPVVEAPAEKPAEPVAEKPVAPEAEKPVEAANEKPAAPMNEMPNAPVNEKPNAPVNEKPMLPVNEKPLLPVNEKPLAPIAEKPEAPAMELPKMPAAKPEHHPLPVLEGMMEMQKAPYPPVAAPLTTGANPAPLAEAAKELPKPICPPLPPFQDPYATYPQIPVFPHVTAGEGWPQAQHPFGQIPVPAVEAMAYANPGWAPVEEDCYPYIQPAWPIAQMPYAPTYPVMQPQAVQPSMWGEQDCGCGGGSLNLPYAWVPAGNEQPYMGGIDVPNGMPAVEAAEFPEAMPNVMPNAMPAPGYGWPETTAYPYPMYAPYAGIPQASPYQGMEYPGNPAAEDVWASVSPMSSSPAEAEPLQTYATPYANPYAFPSFEPHQAPHAGGGEAESAGNMEPVLQAASPAKEAKKDTGMRSSPRARAVQSPLQEFLNRHRNSRPAYEPRRNSRPWINL
ncbi:LysM peptidoglycan-binding domain-containing protein [Gorillibacterium sp. sgz5001074]|uniref:LysM peptidoglycan-binding domain-containing protein n=1 Tax=Gorillibacterium sp. sgz5001074 TaxID=3446695 RepID=UPI003F670ED2